MIRNTCLRVALLAGATTATLSATPARAETAAEHTRALVARLQQLRATRPDVLARNRRLVIDTMAAASPERRRQAIADDTTWSMAHMMDRARGGLNVGAAFGRFSGEHGNDFMNRGAASPGKLHELGKALSNMPRPCAPSVGGPSLIHCSGSSSYPSGHTAKGTGAALLAAWLVPERFQSFITRAQDYGESRVVAGVHYPLDVMASRSMTYKAVADLLAAQVPDQKSWLNVAVNPARVRADAVAGCGGLSIARCAASRVDGFSDRAANKALYDRTAHYGFQPLGPTDAAMEVPDNAEYLISTRFGYLTAAQQREVIRTTAYASGGVLDDAWSRIDLFAAADGYGRFDGATVIRQDAARGGFAAEDTFANDIAGRGSLTHLGTGTLILTGDNGYSGGTIVREGVIVTGSRTALGTGDVTVDGGTLRVGADGLAIGGDYLQAAGGTLDLGGVLDIAGQATLDGNLLVRLSDLGAGRHRLISWGDARGRFANVTFEGLAPRLRGWISYDASGVSANVAAVPEPAGWAMMAAGFGLAGVAVRRRRRGMPAMA